MRVAIGMFDGVHLGHQAVIDRLVADARRETARAVIITFDQHPAAVVAPERAPSLIQTLAQRLRMFAVLGVDATWLIHFDRAFSEQSGEAFVRGLARDFGRLCAVYVGEQFHFGHRRSGNVQLLRQLGAELGFATHAVAPFFQDGQIVSSTRVRERIRTGDLHAVRRLLGRRYTLAGPVITGDRLGRSLGFPTANLDVPRLVLPPQGVYMATAQLPDWSGPAVVNLGVRPTLGTRESRLQVEAHLLDFTREIGGTELELCFLAKLREEQRFPDLAALRLQIEADCRVARERYPALLAEAQPGP